MTDLHVTTRPDGLRIASEAMDGVQSVALGVWVDTGTRCETAAQNGVAHLFEHMVFKGTPSRSAQQIAEAVEAVGGSMNAYTGREVTAYYLRLLAEDTALGVHLLADMLQHSLFDDAELARERQVVLQEIGQARDTPDDIIFDHFQETAFAAQPLGYPVLGRDDVVAVMPRQALLDYRDRHYTPDRMVIAAAGAVDHDRLCALVDAAFTALPAPQSTSLEPARYTGGEYREADTLEQTHLLLGFPGPAFGDDNHLAAGVLSTLFGGGMSSRLFQEVREKRGLAYSVYSFTDHFCDSGIFGIYAGTGPEDVSALIPVLTDEIHRITNDPVPEEEVRRAQNQLKAGLLMARESAMARCEQLARHLMIYGRPLPTAEIVARIEAVDADRLQALARRLFSARPTLAALGPVSRLESYDKVMARLAA